jgi:hypothetical protein
MHRMLWVWLRLAGTGIDMNSNAEVRTVLHTRSRCNHNEQQRRNSSLRE